MTENDLGICESCGSSIPLPSRFCSGCGREFSAIRAGEVLDGKYEILGKLAEGGMGEVFRARHLHLDEIRIIKVMKPLATADASHQRRFSEEARLATQVRHPNVAALYDFSKLPSGSYYMVWEFIDGTTLLHRLRRGGPLSADEAVDIGTQVLSGLSEIHRVGVVHRDVSPDNIMIVEKEGRRVAKLIDLGIAKKIAEDGFGMTATGMFLGKLKYCSPEQAGSLPRGAKLDGRSDLYSFGAVLYEMLSGEPLFESPTPEGYIVKHLQEEPPVLRRDDLPPEIGSRLAAIVAKALQKDRNRRFTSADEFAAALSALRSLTATMPTARFFRHPEEETRRIAEPTAETTSIQPRAPAAKRAIRAAIAFCVILGALAAGYAWRKGRSASVSPSVESKPAPPSAERTKEPPPQAARLSTPSAPPKIIESRAAAPALEATTTPKKLSAGASVPRASRASTPTTPPAPTDESAAIAKFEELRKSAESGTPRDVDALVDFVTNYTFLNPTTPFSDSLKTELPSRLKSRGERAYAAGHFWRAFRIYQICNRLPFAPKDPEVETRLEELRSQLQPRKRGFRR